MSAFAIEEIQRPLRLGELLTATVRIYSGRGWAFALLGLVPACALIVQWAFGWLPGLAALAISFSAVYAVIVRLVAGDAVAAAARRAILAAPVLIVLALVVAVPFYLGGIYFIFLVFSALWLGLTAFAIPAAMVEEPQQPGLTGRLLHALRRTTSLARVEYMHAVGVAAALIGIYVVLGIVLAIAIHSASDLEQVWAIAAAQVPLAPFFFIGLSVLYFDQQARLAEARGAPKRR